MESGPLRKSYSVGHRLTQLRRPFKVVAVALANKMARIAWALLARGGTYRAPQLVAV